MANTRPHWSYSALNQYLRCPLQYYFERVQRLTKPTIGAGAALGSAVHAALADYHQRLVDDRPTTQSAMQLAFLARWEETEARQSIVYRAGESRHDQIDVGLNLLELYRQQPPPQHIVAIEQTVWAPLINSRGEILEKPLVAILDLLVEEADELVIREFKTSGRAYGTSEVQSSLQATCYVNAAWHEWDRWAAVEFAVLVKTKRPRLQTIPTSRMENDLQRLGDLVEAVERAVAQRHFYPVETPLNCSGCPFRSPCREWQGPSHVPVELPRYAGNGSPSC